MFGNFLPFPPVDIHPRVRAASMTALAGLLALKGQALFPPRGAIVFGNCHVKEGILEQDGKANGIAGRA